MVLITQKGVEPPPQKQENNELWKQGRRKEGVLKARSYGEMRPPAYPTNLALAALSDKEAERGEDAQRASIEVKRNTATYGDGKTMTRKCHEQSGRDQRKM